MKCGVYSDLLHGSVSHNKMAEIVWHRERTKKIEDISSDAYVQPSCFAYLLKILAGFIDLEAIEHNLIVVMIVTALHKNYTDFFTSSIAKYFRFNNVRRHFYVIQDKSLCSMPLPVIRLHKVKS